VKGHKAPTETANATGWQPKKNQGDPWTEGLSKGRLTGYDNQQVNTRLRQWVAEGKLDQVPVDTLWKLVPESSLVDHYADAALAPPQGQLQAQKALHASAAAAESMVRRMDFSQASPAQVMFALKFIRVNESSNPDRLARVFVGLARNPAFADAKLWRKALLATSTPVHETTRRVFDRLAQTNPETAARFALGYFTALGNAQGNASRLIQRSEGDAQLNPAIEKLDTKTLKLFREHFTSRSVDGADRELLQQLDKLLAARE
jgi:hypothetical protein